MVHPGDKLRLDMLKLMENLIRRQNIFNQGKLL